MIMPMPEIKDWEEIFYHPESFITTYMGHPFELVEKEGWTVKAVKENKDVFASNLRKGIRVELIPPPDLQYCCVKPLSDMHTQFFNLLSSVLHDVYPFGKRYKKSCAMRGGIHSEIADWYWRDIGNTWKNYTPDEWHDLLDAMLMYIKDHKLKRVENIPNFIKEAKEDVKKMMKG